MVGEIDQGCLRALDTEASAEPDSGAEAGHEGAGDDAMEGPALLGGEALEAGSETGRGSKVGMGVSVSC